MIEPKIELRLSFDPTPDTALWVKTLQPYRLHGHPSLLVRGEAGTWERNLAYFAAGTPLPPWWVETVADLSGMRARQHIAALRDRLCGVARAGYQPLISRYLSAGDVALVRSAGSDGDALLTRLENALVRLGGSRDAVVSASVVLDEGCSVAVDPADALRDGVVEELRLELGRSVRALLQTELPVPPPSPTPPRAPVAGGRPGPAGEGRPASTRNPSRGSR